MKKSTVKILLVLFTVFQVHAQVALRNQTNITYWQEKKLTVWENWLEAYFAKKWLHVGLLLEVNDPPDPFVFMQPEQVKKYDLTHRFIEFRKNKWNLTLGTFHTTFGRGLTLRAFEDRNLRLDNDIEGGKIKYQINRLTVTALAGRMRDRYNRRKAGVGGLDVQCKMNEWLSIGGSCSYQDSGERKAIGALTLGLRYDWFDIYGEIARPSWENRLNPYVLLSADFDKVTMFLEYKDYLNLLMTNKHDIEVNVAPAVSRQHDLTLLNRHPHFLNMNDERGFQIETVYSASPSAEITLHYAYTEKHDDAIVFQEFYSEFQHQVEQIDIRTAFSWRQDMTMLANFITPVIEVYKSISVRDQLHLNYQHQHAINRVDKSEYDTEYMIFEYSHSPLISLSFVGEYTNKYLLRNASYDRHLWGYVSVAFNLSANHQIQVLGGSRQAGFICVGGLCRYEPEFQGILCRISNRF